MARKPTPPVEHPFKHRQRVAILRWLGRCTADGQLVYREDWSETGEVRALDRDWRPMGMVVVKFDHGGALCIDKDQLRAA